MKKFATVAATIAFIGATCAATNVSADPLNLLSFAFQPPASPARSYEAPAPRYNSATLRSEDSGASAMAYASPSQDGSARSIDSRLQRQVVNYPTHEASGTIVIDTPNMQLYLVMANGKAVRYGIGVGREGFTWAGTQTITNKKEWPDWTPPEEMIQRQPYLPRFMAGGPGNPLGARAMYLGSTVYRIHGTNDPTTIGKHVSSGCIRLTNEDVSDLYSRVNVGTKVVVLPMSGARTATRGAY
jgi:lipoprotein-anchoring transpeptidase ErfK/SrfK